MKKLTYTKEHKETGNGMLVTVILLLVLTIVTATCMNLADVRLKITMTEKNSSNTYYVAKSGIEQQVETINKALEAEVTSIIKVLEDEYLKKVIPKDEGERQNFISSGTGAYTKLQSYDASIGEISFDDTEIQTLLQREIKEFVKVNYLEKMKNPGTGFRYSVQGDRQTSDYQTEVEVTCPKGDFESDDSIIFIATSVTEDSSGNIYDQQKVRASVILDIQGVTNVLHEKYEWPYGYDTSADTYLMNGVPESLRGGIVSFSDLGITDGKLTVTGDLYVKGQNKKNEYLLSEVEGSMVPTADTFPDTEINGGVTVTNKGNLAVNGSLYCINNVLASNGWGSAYDYYGTDGTTPIPTSIHITGNVICNTLGIVDDFYKGGSNQVPFDEANQGKHISITVGGDVMVENDVMIERYVKDSKIKVDHTIFGTSDGKGTVRIGTTDVIDPNLSSGVYCRGYSSTIEADKAFVIGQPFITFASTGMLPMKLYESIGEPYDGVSDWEGYKTGDSNNSRNKDYLLATSPFNTLIKRDKITLTSPIGQSYAAAKISANGTTDSGTAVLLNGNNAIDFFYEGGSSYKMSDFTSNTSVDYTVANIALAQTTSNAPLYTGVTSITYDGTTVNTLGKVFAKDDLSMSTLLANNLGLRSYMNYMRSIFYGKFQPKVHPTDFSAELKQLSFAEVINLGAFTDEHEWTYDTPIEVITGTATIDISKFYAAVGTGSNEAYPSVIINNSTGDLKLKASDPSNSTFKGVIISKGPIKFESNINIEGNIIVGGNAEGEVLADNRAERMKGEQTSIDVQGKEVTVTCVPNNVLKITSKDAGLYRKVLDALNITDTSGGTFDKVIGPIGTDSNQLQYNSSKVVFMKDSSIEVRVQKVDFIVESLKKID